MQNPCAAIDIGSNTATQDAEEEPATETGYVGNKIVMFHNGKGPMCIKVLELIGTIDYPIKQHLNTKADFQEGLNELKGVYGRSGVYQLPLVIAL